MRSTRETSIFFFKLLPFYALEETRDVHISSKRAKRGKLARKQEGKEDELEIERMGKRKGKAGSGKGKRKERERNGGSSQK